MFKYAVHLGLTLCLMLIVSTIQVEGEKDKKLTLRNLEKIKEDEKNFQSSVQLSEPDAEGHIKISGELKQLITLDNEWKVNITVFRKNKPEDEYTKLKEMPLMGICELMGSYYKTMFYEKIKEYSNAPHPDTCPLPLEHYHLKDYPLDSSQLKKFLIPGFYEVFIQILKDEQSKLEYRAEIQVE